MHSMKLERGVVRSRRRSGVVADGGLQKECGMVCFRSHVKREGTREVFAKHRRVHIRQAFGGHGARLLLLIGENREALMVS